MLTGLGMLGSQNAWGIEGPFPGMLVYVSHDASIGYRLELLFMNFPLWPREGDMLSFERSVLRMSSPRKSDRM